MKTIIILLALIGLCKARPPIFHPVYIQPRILRNYYNLDVGVPQAFQYAVDTEDGFHNAVIGQVENPETDDEALAVEGMYSYIGPDGKNYTVYYTADKDGFHPTGEHLTQSAGTKRKLGIPSAALASLAGGGIG